MKIRCGSTRVVFLFKHFVVKIPRIGFLYMIRRFIFHVKSGKAKEKIDLFKYRFGSIPGYLIRGFIANRVEYCFSKSKVRNNNIVHIPVSYLFLGFIIVQPRGKFISRDDKEWKKFIKRLIKKGVKVHDLLISKNYSFYENKICLHDYGDVLTTDFLLSY